MDSHERERFAAELHRLRDRAGLSLGELAGRAHVNRGYVGHIEHGQRWPSRPIATALDDALDARGALVAAWTAGNCAASPAAVTIESDDETLTLPLAEWAATDGEALAERLAIGSDHVLSPTAARSGHVEYRAGNPLRAGASLRVPDIQHQPQRAVIDQVFSHPGQRMQPANLTLGALVPSITVRIV